MFYYRAHVLDYFPQGAIKELLCPRSIFLHHNPSGTVVSRPCLSVDIVHIVLTVVRIQNIRQAFVLVLIDNRPTALLKVSSR